jgi:hypothetical protein
MVLNWSLITLMVGSLQSSRQTVRKTRFVRWAHLTRGTRGGADLEKKKEMEKNVKLNIGNKAEAPG